MLELFPSRTVIVSVAGFEIRWYGFLYVVAFWFAWFVAPYLARKHGEKDSRELWGTIVAYGALGVVVGGRLGYAIFYEPGFFWEYPLAIIQIWHGGMSSHGGFIGAALFVWLATRFSFRKLIAIADIVAIPSAVGIALGRIGNFINQELYGTVTTLPWGMLVPEDSLLHHPIQIYDALGMMVLAIVCFMLLNPKIFRGVVFALFIVWYCIQRFLLEYIRLQEWQGAWGLSYGQILTIPLLFAGVLLCIYAYKYRIYGTIQSVKS